ncbi:hypothetical protein GGR53DRAFT_14748 [Hypoxylon sp. FL1150]|nr:hypothetical protein GGR53DRAFT_14748 [Hypoxylon sp. FL1150]
MFRLFRFLRAPPKSYSLGARVHGAHSPSAQVFRVQRVKFRRKWFKPRNFLIAGCVYYACYQIYTASVFGTISDRSDEETKQMTRKEREELEENMLEPIFIPLPFTMKLVESPPFKNTDPEWQGFIKVNKNRELLRSIRNELAELVRKMAAANPRLVQICGSDMKLGKFWLDIQYPYRPPPMFVRKGLSIGDNGVFLVEEPMDPVAAVWISRALYPSVLTASLWSFSATLMKQNAANLAKLLGYEQQSPTSPPSQQTIERVAQHIRKSTAKSDSQGSSSFPPVNTQASDGSPPGSTSVDKRPAGSSPTPGTSPNSSVIPIVPSAEPGKPKSVRDIHGIKHTQEHTSGAWSAFKEKFAQTWRPMREQRPRGAIYLSGLVEIYAPRALITVDCTVWWDPKTEKFDMKTAVFRIRSLRMKTQSAAGR